MTILSFKTKKDKHSLLEKARKMEEYAAMIVECIEESDHDEDHEERAYRHEPYRHHDPYMEDYERMDERVGGRYGYRRMR